MTMSFAGREQIHLKGDKKSGRQLPTSWPAFNSPEWHLREWMTPSARTSITPNSGTLAPGVAHLDHLYHLVLGVARPAWEGRRV
jgi:hypothetical protein